MPPAIRLWTVNLATTTRAWANNQAAMATAYKKFFTEFKQPRGKRELTAGFGIDLNKGTGNPVNLAFETNHAVLETELPDFVGTQESTSMSAGELCKALAALRAAGSGPKNWRYLTGVQYASIGHKRKGGIPALTEERCSIVYRSDRWQVDKSSAFYTGLRTALQASQEVTIRKNWFNLQPDSVFQPVQDRIRESGTGDDFADDTVQVTWRIRAFPGDGAASSPAPGAPTFKNNAFVEADSYGGPAFDQGNGKVGGLYKPSYGPYTRIVTWGIFKPRDGSFSPDPNFQILVVNCQLPRKSNYRDIWLNGRDATGPVVPASGISWNGSGSNCKDIFSGLTDLQRNKILEPILEDIICEYWARCEAAVPAIKPYVCVIGDMNDRMFGPNWDGQNAEGDLMGYGASRKSGATATRNNAILARLFGDAGGAPLLKLGAGPQENFDPANAKGKPLGASKDSGSKDWAVYATSNPATTSTSKFFFGFAHPLTDGGTSPLTPAEWPDQGFTDHWWVKQMKLKFPTLP